MGRESGVPTGKRALEPGLKPGKGRWGPFGGLWCCAFISSPQQPYLIAARVPVLSLRKQSLGEGPIQQGPWIEPAGERQPQYSNPHQKWEGFLKPLFLAKAVNFLFPPYSTISSKKPLVCYSSPWQLAQLPSHPPPHSVPQCFTPIGASLVPWSRIFLPFGIICSSSFISSWLYRSVK